jgi:hypothetical protein
MLRLHIKPGNLFFFPLFFLLYMKPHTPGTHRFWSGSLIRMPNEQVKIVMAVVLPRWKPGAQSTCEAMFWVSSS